MCGAAERRRRHLDITIQKGFPLSDEMDFMIPQMHLPCPPSSGNSPEKWLDRRSGSDRLRTPLSYRQTWGMKSRARFHGLWRTFRLHDPKPKSLLAMALLQIRDQWLNPYDVWGHVKGELVLPGRATGS